MSSELSTGKTIIILAVVLGCFAVLWPKVFQPMLLAQVQSPASQALSWKDPSNIHHLSQLCYLLEDKRPPHLASFSHWDERECLGEVQKVCRISPITENIFEGFRLSKDKTNLTGCLEQHYGLTPTKVSSATPPNSKTKFFSKTPHPHARPERPPHLHPDQMHPALREKGRPLPQRTIEKQARPGPKPGVRPPMGAGAHMVPPQTKGSGAMSIIMPLYTVGIVIFFVYTIMKVVFKKAPEEDKTPKLKDFHMDPEYRKYVFEEEYLDSSNSSHRDSLRRQEREISKRRRQEAIRPETKIEDEQMDQLRRRLEETELAMERLMSQMGSVTDKLTAAKITEVLTQAQAQAKMLKDREEGHTGDLTPSEACTNTLSEDFSLPVALQHRLKELQVKDHYIKGTSQGTVNVPTPAAAADEGNDEIFIDPESREVIRRSPLIISDETGVVTSATKDSNDHNLNAQKENDKIEDVKQLQPPSPNQLKVEKEAEEDETPSDIAQRDTVYSGKDFDSSEASETGADVSELRSFADEGVSPVVPTSVSIPAVIEEDAPEVKFQAPAGEEAKATETSTQTTFEKEEMPKSTNVEHSTQTEAEKKLSVLNLQTEYLIQDKKEKQEDSPPVSEILLDATVPIDTQLLVQEAHGHILKPTKDNSNLEIITSEAGSPPCVVTSQVSLAFVGLEQGISTTPPTLVVPENLAYGTDPHILDKVIGGAHHTQAELNSELQIKDDQPTSDEINKQSFKEHNNEVQEQQRLVENDEELDETRIGTEERGKDYANLDEVNSRQVEEKEEICMKDEKFGKEDENVLETKSQSDLPEDKLEEPKPLLKTASQSSSQPEKDIHEEKPNEEFVANKNLYDQEICHPSDVNLTSQSPESSLQSSAVEQLLSPSMAGKEDTEEKKTNAQDIKSGKEGIATSGQLCTQEIHSEGEEEEVPELVKVGDEVEQVCIKQEQQAPDEIEKVAQCLQESALRRVVETQKEPENAPCENQTAKEPIPEGNSETNSEKTEVTTETQGVKQKRKDEENQDEGEEETGEEEEEEEEEEQEVKEELHNIDLTKSRNADPEIINMADMLSQDSTRDALQSVIKIVQNKPTAMECNPIEEESFTSEDTNSPTLRPEQDIKTELEKPNLYPLEPVQPIPDEVEAGSERCENVQNETDLLKNASKDEDKEVHLPDAVKEAVSRLDETQTSEGQHTDCGETTDPEATDSCKEKQEQSKDEEVPPPESGETDESPSNRSPSNEKPCDEEPKKERSFENLEENHLETEDGVECQESSAVGRGGETAPEKTKDNALECPSKSDDPDPAAAAAASGEGDDVTPEDPENPLEKE